MVSSNGWTSNDLGLEWLIKFFEPLMAPWGKDWRLLVLDGHVSYVLDGFVFFVFFFFFAVFFFHFFFLFFLPAHSFYVTQPLDVGFFSSLKLFYLIFLEVFGYEYFPSPL